MGETQSVQIQADPVVDEAMQNAIGGPGNVPANPEAAPAAERPEWLPEKFESPEALANAYKELEGRQRNPDAPEAAPAPNKMTIEKPAEAAPGLDAERFQKEFAETGTLSEQSQNELKGAGLTQDMVDAHLAGLGALRDQQVGKLNEIAGGQEKFDAMKTWAAANLGEGEIDAFNTTMNGSDVSQMELAMAGLRARYEGSSAGQAAPLEGQTGGGMQGYGSTAQMVEAMSDPRYAKDPAYRAEVMAKVKAGMPTVRSGRRL